MPSWNPAPSPLPRSPLLRPPTSPSSLPSRSPVDFTRVDPALVGRWTSTFINLSPSSPYTSPYTSPTLSSLSNPLFHSISLPSLHLSPTSHLPPSLSPSLLTSDHYDLPPRPSSAFGQTSSLPITTRRRAPANVLAARSQARASAGRERRSGGGRDGEGGREGEGGKWSGKARSKEGKQINNSKYDHTKMAQMAAVRDRQKQYSSQLGASANDPIALQIDSITRMVVTNFRKLISCERCALFLLDAEANELYFKPVSGLDAAVPEIRFPSRAGIAGHVATTGNMLNVPDAYKDSRFNRAIDKQTSFKTRTVLCMPVVDSQGKVIAVCQMVNKFEHVKAKGGKEKGGEGGGEKKWRKFEREDEQILKRCCDHISEALSSIQKLKEHEERERLAQAEAKKKAGARDGGMAQGDRARGKKARRVSPSPDGGGGTPAISPTVSPAVKARSLSVTSIASLSPAHNNRSLASDALEAAAATKHLISKLHEEVKLSEASAGSLGASSANEHSFGSRGAGMAEEAAKFQFRTEASGPQMTSKGQTMDAPEKRAALTREKRKKAYVDQVQNKVQNSGLNDVDVAMNSCLRTMMVKFKLLLDCERCGLFFVDNDTDELYFHLEEEGAAVRFPKSEGIAGAVATQCVSLHVPDAYKDSRFNREIDKLTHFLTRDILCQPVVDENGEVPTVRAVIQMVNSNKDHGFTKEDMRVLVKYAKKVSEGLVAISEAFRESAKDAKDAKDAKETKDGGADSNADSKAESRMHQVESMNVVLKEITDQIEAEKHTILAKRKEESRHELTTGEANSRFQFRENKAEKKEKKGEEEDTPESREKSRIDVNKKKFDDIFSGKMEMKTADEMLMEEKMAEKEARDARRAKARKERDARDENKLKPLHLSAANRAAETETAKDAKGAPNAGKTERKKSVAEKAIAEKVAERIIAEKAIAEKFIAEKTIAENIKLSGL